MFKKVVLILGLLTLMPSTVQAQFIQPLEQKDMRNQQVMSGLVSAMDAAPSNNGLSSVRGTKGAAKNPLGQYLIAPNTEFKSICLASICFAGSDSLNLPLEIPVISVDFLFSGFF